MREQFHNKMIVITVKLIKTMNTKKYHTVETVVKSNRKNRRKK